MIAYYQDQTLKLGILLAVGAILVKATGRIVRTEESFWMEKMLDSFIDMIPFLGSIYKITKVTIETVFGGRKTSHSPSKSPTATSG